MTNIELKTCLAEQKAMNHEMQEALGLSVYKDQLDSVMKIYKRYLPDPKDDPSFRPQKKGYAVSDKFPWIEAKLEDHREAAIRISIAADKLKAALCVVYML